MAYHIEKYGPANLTVRKGSVKGMAKVTLPDRLKREFGQMQLLMSMCKAPELGSTLGSVHDYVSMEMISDSRAGKDPYLRLQEL